MKWFKRKKHKHKYFLVNRSILGYNFECSGCGHRCNMEYRVFWKGHYRVGAQLLWRSNY